jgi:hypothetical protein
MPTPARVFDTMMATEKAFALKAGIDLDVFTAIGDGATTPDAIAARTGASERGVRILCDFLVVNGFLTKGTDGYGLAPDAAAFLNRRSPAYMGSTADFLCSDHMVDRLRNLTATVRAGTTTPEAFDPDHPMWITFARAMAPMMGFVANLVAARVAGSGPLRVLDIAAGHGMYGICCLLANPEARVVGLDWPAVLAVAQENADRMGVADRFEQHAGSAFELDFNGPYDLVLVPNFLHHFSRSVNVAFLTKVFASVKPGGRVAVVEFVPNEDRVSPPMAAAFSLTMLNGTPEGDAYTFAEHEGMLEEAGFVGATLDRLEPSPQALILANRPS